MKGIRKFWLSFKNGDKKSAREKLMLLALAGLLLLVIVWPVSDGSTADSASEGSISENHSSQESAEAENGSSGTEDYAALMEQRLENILGQIDGAGKVEVMITVKSSSEQVVEKDTSGSSGSSSQTAEDGSSSSESSGESSESTVYDSSDSPYVIKELEPEVEGILVVAEGGGDETVVNEITYAVQALFDVPVHKIKVVKMSAQ